MPRPDYAKATTWSLGPSGGTTRPDNGLLLCWAHHDWVHERDIRIIALPDGGLRFEGADGRCHGTTYPRLLTLPG